MMRRLKALALAALLGLGVISADAQVSPCVGVSCSGGSGNITNDTVNNITNVTNNFNIQQNSDLYTPANNATGTTVNLLAKITATGAQTLTTSDTTGNIIGICDSNCGTTGNANIAFSGIHACVFDGGITSGDFVGASTSAGGKCTDLGSVTPQNVQVIGIVTDTTNGSAGTYKIDFTPMGMMGAIVQQIKNGRQSAVSLGTFSSGTKTVDCTKGSIQNATNGGAFTLAAPTTDGTCDVLITNNASAGTITFSGFSEGVSAGDALDTTNGDAFTLGIWRINGTSGYRVASHQGGGMVLPPQGRLTLVTATPVLTSDQTAKAQIFYDCFVGNLVPYWTGTGTALDIIASCEVSLTMVAGSATQGGDNTTTGGINNNSVYDIWWVHAGANRVCVATGGASGHSSGGWSSDSGSNTARGTGYSQVHNTKGFWTNVNAIAHCWNGSTDYGSVSADQATLLGSFYTTAAGQTGVAFKAAAAAGGGNPFVALANIYNTKHRTSQSIDSTTSWTQTSNTWAALDNGATGSGLNNRVSWVDPLGINDVATWIEMSTSTTATAAVANLAIWLNASSGSPTRVCAAQTDGVANTISWQHCELTFAPANAGLSFAQAGQANLANTGTATYLGTNNGNGDEQLTVGVDY